MQKLRLAFHHDKDSSKITYGNYPAETPES